MEGLYLTYLVHLAYFFTLLSYCFRNVNFLRFFALVASAIAIYYSFCVSEVPLWTPILWHSLFTLVNITQLSVALWRRRSVRLNPTENFLAKTALAPFPPAELRAFVALGNKVEVPAGTQFIQQGGQLQELYCILNGQVEVSVQGRRVAELGPGRFVGEMSLLTRSLTRADVQSATDLQLIVWTHQEIERWVDGEATRLATLQTALGTQIVEQLLAQNLNEGELAG